MNRGKKLTPCECPCGCLDDSFSLCCQPCESFHGKLIKGSSK